MDEKRLRVIFALGIGAAWAVSFLVGLVSPDYNPPATVHALMVIVATWLFSDTLLKDVRDARRARAETTEGEPDEG